MGMVMIIDSSHTNVFFILLWTKQRRLKQVVLITVGICCWGFPLTYLFIFSYLDSDLKFSALSNEFDKEMIWHTNCLCLSVPLPPPPTSFSLTHTYMHVSAYMHADWFGKHSKNVKTWLFIFINVKKRDLKILYHNIQLMAFRHWGLNMMILLRAVSEWGSQGVRWPHVSKYLQGSENAWWLTDRHWTYTHWNRHFSSQTW